LPDIAPLSSGGIGTLSGEGLGLSFSGALPSVPSLTAAEAGAGNGLLSALGNGVKTLGSEGLGLSFSEPLPSVAPLTAAEAGAGNNLLATLGGGGIKTLGGEGLGLSFSDPLPAVAPLTAAEAGAGNNLLSGLSTMNAAVDALPKTMTIDLPSKLGVVGDTASGLLDWIKANPGLASLLAGAVAGLGSSGNSSGSSSGLSKTYAPQAGLTVGKLTPSAPIYAGGGVMSNQNGVRSYTPTAYNPASWTWGK
jgi:hypothetical protein